MIVRPAWEVHEQTIGVADVLYRMGNHTGYYQQSSIAFREVDLVNHAAGWRVLPHVEKDDFKKAERYEEAIGLEFMIDPAFYFPRSQNGLVNVNEGRIYNAPRGIVDLTQFTSFIDQRLRQADDNAFYHRCGTPAIRSDGLWVTFSSDHLYPFNN